MSLFLDLSQFLADPMRTGIQRIGGEICRYLPRNAAIPVRLHSGRLLALPPELIDAIAGYFRDTSESAAANITRFGAVENGSPVELSSCDTVLVPEIFGEDRAAFFLAMNEAEFKRCRFIVYDLLPLSHPEYFPRWVPLAMSLYYKVVREASGCGFISEYTRDTYYSRLKRARSHEGVVLALGSDSLGPRVETPRLDRPLTFSVLGTIEPRKNHELILEAFAPLLRQVKALRLNFIGKMGWVDREFAQKVHNMAADKSVGFEFYSVLDDHAIRRCVSEARATIYVSTAEGYGLPPVESLWLGTPVIASATIPSLQPLGNTGIHYVEPLNAHNLRQAVLAFLDDTYANQKTEETAHLNLPTWHSFTQEVVQWCMQ